MTENTSALQQHNDHVASAVKPENFMDKFQENILEAIDLRHPIISKIGLTTDLSKILPHNPFGRFLRTVQKNAPALSLPANLSASDSEALYAAADYDLGQTVYQLKAVYDFMPEHFNTAVEQLFGWIKTQWEHDSQPYNQRQGNSTSRLKLYYSVSYALQGASDLMLPKDFLAKLQQFRLTGMVLPFYKERKVYLADILSVMVLTNRGALATSLLHTGWKPVDVMQTSERLYGVTAKFNVTRLMYEADKQFTHLPSMLETQGFLANETRSISSEKTSWLCPLDRYTGVEHAAFRLKSANLALIESNEHSSEDDGMPPEQLHARLASVIHDHMNVLQWYEWCDCVVPGENDEDLLPLSSGDNTAKVLQTAKWLLLTLVDAGHVDLIAGSTWLVDPQAGHFVNLDETRAKKKLVVNIKTPEQERLARKIAVGGQVYIVAPGAPDGLFRL